MNGKVGFKTFWTSTYIRHIFRIQSKKFSSMNISWKYCECLAFWRVLSLYGKLNKDSFLGESTFNSAKFLTNHTTSRCKDSKIMMNTFEQYQSSITIPILNKKKTNICFYDRTRPHYFAKDHKLPYIQRHKNCKRPQRISWGRLRQDLSSVTFLFVLDLSFCAQILFCWQTLS